jgi:pilus assembly protein CpaE
MSPVHILVVDDNEKACQMLAYLLTRRDYQVTTNTKPIEALKWVRRPGNIPDLILLDIMMPAMDGFEFLRQLRADPIVASIPVIMLTARGHSDDKVAGFEAGADDYLVKPINAAELEVRIRALLARSRAAMPAPAASGATVFTVFSLRGGVGTTSVAVNLAVALATLWDIQVPLLDLALRKGHCAWMLNLRPRYTISDLVESKESTVDSEVVEHMLLTHGSGVKLLAAPTSPVDAELITPIVLDRAWPHLLTGYRFLVVDAGSDLSELTLIALERAHTVLLMLAPEMLAVKSAFDALGVFDRLDFNPDRTLPVLNTIFPRDGLTRQKVEKALGCSVDTVIPYERTSFVQAINSGRPLIITDPKAPASVAIATLAHNLSAAEMESEEIANPSQLLSMVQRLSQAS